MPIISKNNIFVNRNNINLIMKLRLSRKLKIMTFDLSTFNLALFWMVQFWIWSRYCWEARFSFGINFWSTLMSDATWFLRLYEQIPIISRLIISSVDRSSTNLNFESWGMWLAFELELTSYCSKPKVLPCGSGNDVQKSSHCYFQTILFLISTIKLGLNLVKLSLSCGLG